MVSMKLLVAALVGLAVSEVDAHGTLAKPGLTFTGKAYAGDFSALVPMSKLKEPSGKRFATMDATANARVFATAFKASSYKTLKDFILKNQDLSKGRFSNPKTAECGFTDPNKGPVQALPDKLEWYGGRMNHPGPCEVWCDNEVVVPFTADCAATYPQGKISYNKAKCTGKSRLTLYWMSTLMEWQVYIDCAKIGNGRKLEGEDAALVAASNNSTSA
uniref:Uncharacterized protein n=1 Tax=Globisporangium ultimum (strain ATCC 200006 / CBS 805.95 / DAOM BR144) TaxID=431595 RepID=K3WDM0_GLOUD